MSANLKYRCKELAQVKADAENAVKAILMSAKTSTEQTITFQVELYVVGHGAHPFGSASKPTDYIDLAININRVGRFEGYGECDVNRFVDFFTSALNKTNNNPTMQVVSETIYPYCGANNLTIKNFPKEVVFIKPCKEYETLSKMLLKYTNTPIKPTEWYKINLFGKRGSYNESGSKKYNCQSSELCTKIINDVRKHRTSKDKLVFALITNDDIDTEYSRRYETECYGTRTIDVKITITTPTGRVKFEKTY